MSTAADTAGTTRGGHTIEAQALSKRYGHTVAVDDLSFVIRPGVVTGLLGPNGAGKSTTMRMILGLDHPSAGSVSVDGSSFPGLAAPMSEVGALLDAGAVDGRRTAYRHLLWLARAGGIPRSRVDEVISEVGLSSVAGKRIGGFSLGMSQRLGIAAAILGDPRTLLFDEPVNGLDPEGIRWVRRLLRGLAAEGRTVVVSSHLMSEIEQTADHVLVMGRGKLVADASIGELTREGPTTTVRVVSPDAIELREAMLAAGADVTEDANGAMITTGIDAAGVGELAAARGLRLHELTPQRARLEEAFFELTEGSVEYQAAAAEEGR